VDCVALEQALVGLQQDRGFIYSTSGDFGISSHHKFTTKVVGFLSGDTQQKEQQCGKFPNSKVIRFE